MLNDRLSWKHEPNVETLNANVSSLRANRSLRTGKGCRKDLQLPVPLCHYGVLFALVTADAKYRNRVRGCDIWKRKKEKSLEKSTKWM